MGGGGTQVIEPAALIARIDALGRHGAGHFILSDRSENTLAGGGEDIAAGHIFDGGMPGVEPFHHANGTTP